MTFISVSRPSCANTQHRNNIILTLPIHHDVATTLLQYFVFTWKVFGIYMYICLLIIRNRTKLIQILVIRNKLVVLTQGHELFMNNNRSVHDFLKRGYCHILHVF